MKNMSEYFFEHPVGLVAGLCGRGLKARSPFAVLTCEMNKMSEVNPQQYQVSLEMVRHTVSEEA